jgi:hypothetical protein
VHDVNAKRFYNKKMARIEQDHDKNTYPKLVLNKLKIKWNSTSIYTHWALNSRKLLKKLSTYMWPMSIHVRTNNEK